MLRFIVALMLAVCLPMQVVANSDAPFDQAVKIELRDAIIVSGFREAEEVEAFTNAWLSERAMGYSARVEMSPYMPPGGVEKDTLRVFLGDAQGQNWWGVLFPTLLEQPTHSTIRDLIERFKERFFYA